MKTSHKIWLAISGILLIVLGVMCILKPAETLFNAAVLLGILAVLSGIAKMVFTFQTEKFLPNSGTRMLTSLLQILVGIIILSHKFFVAISLPMVFSLWVIFEGVTLAVQSFDYKKSKFSSWWVLLLLGIAVILLGILALRNLNVAGKTLSLMIGIGIIVSGLGNLFALTGIKQLEKHVKEAREAFRG
jgi:uncharacterized membrane protein HdeD (DUF308 family)